MPNVDRRLEKLERDDLREHSSKASRQLIVCEGGETPEEAIKRSGIDRDTQDGKELVVVGVNPGDLNIGEGNAIH
jgi:hypothetical protein